jgi:hypothetical protein
VIKSVFNLQMSASSESDSSKRHGCDSDGELSVASSYGSEVQDCRKRPRHPQIIANLCLLSWKGWPRKRLPAGKEGLAAATESGIAERDVIAVNSLIFKADGRMEVHDDSGWREVMGCGAETRPHVKINC